MKRLIALAMLMLALGAAYGPIWWGNPPPPARVIHKLYGRPLP